MCSKYDKLFSELPAKITKNRPIVHKAWILARPLLPGKNQIENQEVCPVISDWFCHKYELTALLTFMEPNKQENLQTQIEVNSNKMHGLIPDGP